MTQPVDSNLYHILQLPSFPRPQESEGEGKQGDTSFSTADLLGGYLAGPENRLAELAARFVMEGTPIFDRPVGDKKSSALASANGERSRADVEFLLSAASNAKQSEAVSQGLNLLFDQARFNEFAKQSGEPEIVEYRRFEEVPYLSPLVFYGPSGSGKTRLLEGICQTRRLQEPRKTLYYLSANEFSQALNDAIRRDQAQLFRDLFNRASVVALENCDILSMRETAQIEFLPMLDSALKSRKLVVMTFSQLPSTISGLTPDFVARLSSGLLIPTRLPSRETREFAINRVSERLGLRLDPATFELCVERLPSALSGICASLVQAAREFSTFHTPMTVENMRDYLQRRNPTPEWTLERIIKTVAKYFSVSIVEMRSPKRHKTLVLARQYVAYLARLLTNATLRQIGAQFSARDHSTIVHAIHEMEETLLKSEQARYDLLQLLKLLNAEDKFENLTQTPDNFSEL